MSCPNCSNPTKEHKAEVNMGMKCVVCGKDMTEWAQKKLNFPSEKEGSISYKDVQKSIADSTTKEYKSDEQRNRDFLEHSLWELKKAVSNVEMAIGEMSFHETTVPAESE